MMELYKKQRPKDFDSVSGQTKALSLLRTMVDRDRVPHAILFTGPSGCGKTTLARIMRKKVRCGVDDFYEQNCADIRGIENIRDIRKRMMLRPIKGKSKIWLLDEVHKISNDAQNALLKMLEDTPRHVYFFLCTTDPQKLIKTIRTRCTEISLSPLSDRELEAVILRSCQMEKIKIEQDVLEKIVENSEGSARKALVLLDSIIGVAEDDQIDAIVNATSENQAIQLCRLLLDTRTKWKEVATMLKSLKDEEPEQLRWMMLGYMKSVLLNSGKGRAYNILCAFERNFYDSKHAGLTMACYEIVSGKD